MVNCFSLVSPYYDPLGLALYPLAALINHSCSYNAIVRFDLPSQSMTISALRPITRGEQIFVSYIDATNPYHVRQAELQHRYFFTCECIKCSSELMTERTMPRNPDFEENLLLENRAYELLSLARKDTSITVAIQKLNYGIHILRKTHSWPLHQQPLASLRQELVVSLTNPSQFQLHLALIHAWIQYRLIDPKLMPEKHNPLRLIHQWLIVTLLRRIDPSQGNDLPIQKHNILERSIDLQTIISFILRKLVTVLKGERSESTFSRIVMSSYLQSAEQHASVSRAKFDKEAEKLSLYANEILDKELVWEDAT
jgi:SET domain